MCYHGSRFHIWIRIHVRSSMPNWSRESVPTYSKYFYTNYSRLQNTRKKKNLHTFIPVWNSPMLLKMTSRHLGRMPDSLGLPVIVYVFPDPVIPYVNNRPFFPTIRSSTRSDETRSNNSFCVLNSQNTWVNLFSVWKNEWIYCSILPYRKLVLNCNNWQRRYTVIQIDNINSQDI